MTSTVLSCAVAVLCKNDSTTKTIAAWRVCQYIFTVLHEASLTSNEARCMSTTCQRICNMHEVVWFVASEAPVKTKS